MTTAHAVSASTRTGWLVHGVGLGIVLGASAVAWMPFTVVAFVGTSTIVAGYYLRRSEVVSP
jgi:hypothetical protein